MMLKSCTREGEMKSLLASGAWPHACPPDLRAHVEACRSCGDLVLVTGAFQNARAEAVGRAPAGSPGALWWRAQLRRRNAAVERLCKPILGAQIFALAINITLALAFVVSQARHGIHWLTWLERIPQARTLHLEALWSAAQPDAGWSLYLLIPALATLALVGGVVVYLATEKQ
jgi:hypothetical protein